MMFPKCFRFVILTVIFMLLQGAAGFFVKHVQTGMCINVTGILQTDAPWGNLTYVELSNNCLDPAAQFRFLDNSAMLNLKRKGCFEGTARGGTGYHLPMLYLLLATDPSVNCRDPYHAITQTSWGGLSVFYIPNDLTRCAVPKTADALANKGIDPYIRLTTNCTDAEDKYFNFGTVTCHGNMVRNANCPKDQYMVVKTASYRGLSPIKTCGLSDNYSCEVDVTCLVKKQCDGQHECNITVNDKLFPGDLCPGLTKYLYFEYQCIDTATSFNKRCALLPDKPTNLTVTNITSRSAEISWADPKNTGDDKGRAAVLSGFFIKLKEENSLIRNITTDKVNQRKLTNLTPYTTYEISVAAGNKHGFGKETIYYTFMTFEEAPSGPPLNIKTSSRSTSSSFTWDPPEKDKQNGVIITYTACVSQSENGPCLEIFTTSKWEWVVRNLNASTKYYVRVLASNKAGSSAYSGSKGFFTNGRAAKKGSDVTSSTLTFSLEIPSKTFLYFYVVALKLKDGKEPTPSDSYQNSELVTYAEARKSTNPKPYVAAVVASSGVDENMFILGDGRNTSDPTSQRRRSTSSDYYNGPLEAGTSYSIFQRILLNDKSEYYSTDWSPASKTNEYTGGPRVLTNMSSGDIKAKEGDLVNLLCSAQGEPPITFTWEKDRKPLESFTETKKPHRSSLLVVTVKDQTSFGKYICHIQDRFQSTTHTIWVQNLEDTGKDENDDGSKKYLAGIIVLAILVIILLVILAYFIYQNRRLKSSKANLENKSKDRNNSKDIYENPEKIKDDANYEQVENEQSTYTALKRTGKDENDDHLYSHLNEVHKDYVNQKETGI